MDKIFKIISDGCVVKIVEIENSENLGKTINAIFFKNPDRIVMYVELFKKRVTCSIIPSSNKRFRHNKLVLYDFIKTTDKKSLMKLFGKFFSNDMGIDAVTVKSQIAMIIIKHTSDNEKNNILYILPNELIIELKSFLL